MRSNINQKFHQDPAWFGCFKDYLELLWWLGWWSQLESRLAIGLSVNIHTSLKAFQKLNFRLKFSSLFLSLLWVDSTCSSLLWRSVTPSRAIYSTIIILFQQSKFHYYIGFVSILHCLFSLSILCAAVKSAGFRTFLRCVTDFFYDVRSLLTSAVHKKIK